MVIKLLGTGGADGIPAFYSNSRVSQYARQHGGKDVRSRTAAVVDKHLKIDLGPDTWRQLEREGLDARDWTAILFTHSDADHLSLDELQYAVHPFNDFEYVGFQIYANQKICRQIIERYPDWPFEVFMTRSFEPFEHGGYTITPIKARHKEDEDAHNLLVDNGQQRLLYASDTGIYEDETFEYLCDRHLDCLIIECTDGLDQSSYWGHLDVKELLQVIERLAGQGTVDSKTVICTTHHSHNGDATHAELEDALTPHGIQVGYDGLEIEF